MFNISNGMNVSRIGVGLMTAILTVFFVDPVAADEKHRDRYSDYSAASSRPSK